MIRRDYQEKAEQAIFQEWEKVTATALVMATGLGKTISFAHIIGRLQPLRTLVIAHRKELIDQAVDKIRKVTGLHCGVEMGDNYVNGDLFHRTPVVVATVQSLNSQNGGRMRRFDPMQFGLVVCDEFHHGTSQTYRKVFEWFKQNPALKILGVTATPDRADEEALSQVCDSVAFHYDILDGVTDGWLVPVTQQFCPVSSLDFSEVRTTAGDLNGADLAKIMEAEENVQGVCQPSLEVLYGLAPKTLSAIRTLNWTDYLSALGKEARKAIIFTASVAHAEAVCNIFNRVIPGLAEWICGKTPTEDREDILKRFARGKTRVLANCGVLTEGYDEPTVEVILMARPTKSRSLYTQMIGRSTRPLPGLVDGCATKEGRIASIKASEKPRCRIIDFVGNSGRHKLICALDILGGKSSPEVVERAIKQAQCDGKPVTVLRQLSTSEIQLEQEKEQAKERQRLADEARKKRIVAKSNFDTVDIDPFGHKRFGFGSQTRPKGPEATDAQKRVIGRAGINPVGWTKKQAGMIIGLLAENGWRLPADPKHDWIRNHGKEKVTT